MSASSFTQGRQAFSRWYAGLAGRDRLALQILAAALLLFVLFYVVYQPALEYRERARTASEDAYGNLLWMQSHADDARRLSALTGAGSAGRFDPSAGQSLLSVAGSEASRFGLTLQRFEPRGEDRINVWLDDVPFDAMMRWLQALQQTHGIRIEQISVDRGDVPGIIRARLSLAA